MSEDCGSDKLKGSPLEKSLAKVFLLPSVFGSFPYTLQGGKMRLRYLLVLYILLLRGYHLFQTFKRRDVPQEFTHLPPQSILLVKIFFYNIEISAAISFMRNLYNKHRFNYLVNLISKNDEDFIKNGIDVTYKVNLLYEAVLYGLTTWPFLLRYLGPNTSFELLEEVYFCVGGCLLVADITPFAHLVDLSRSRFESLKRRLEELACKRQDPGRERQLVALSRLHLRTRALCLHLNQCYSYHLLAVFVTIFLNSLIALSVTILLFLGGSPPDVVLFSGSSVPFFQFLCYSIITKCLRAAEEAKEFNSVLYHLMIDDKTETLASNKKLRLHIQMKREVVFSACGFFNLDYSLIHSMIAAATTYLVILIQFGETGAPPTPASPAANLSLHDDQPTLPLLALTSPAP